MDIKNKVELQPPRNGKAMILAAGKGTRLGGLGKKTPKCLLKAGGYTMLEHTIKRLQAAGVRALIINTCHLSNQVKAFLKENSFTGLDIQLSEEEELLGTGGGLKKVSKFFSDDEYFLLHNADVYTDLPLEELIGEHCHHRPLATLAVMERSTTRHLLFNEKEELFGWENKSTDLKEVYGKYNRVIRLAFSGIHVLSPRIFDYMQEESGAFSIITTYMNAIKKGAQIKGFQMDNSYWIDVGTEEKIRELDLHLDPEQAGFS